MNLIISDFDGTFFDDNYEKNIEFIKSIGNDYDFVIATGRSYDFLKKDLKTDCKYYICNDGAYILDSDGNLIYKKFINPNSVKIIYDRINELGYDKYYFDYIEYFDTEIKDNINKITIKIVNNNAEEDLNYLIKDIPDVYGYVSNNWININSISSRKENAIEEILKLNNYKKIYVLGNEINDYGMLNKYNGYLISNESNKEYKTLKSFLDLKKTL